MNHGGTEFGPMMIHSTSFCSSQQSADPQTSAYSMLYRKGPELLKNEKLFQKQICAWILSASKT